jgi:bacillithiol biosynthesis deacetylase BshB1
MKIDLLAIAAHPDDVELTCGGTVLKMAQEGYRTGILDLTKGETGTRGTPETRLREAAHAAKILKVSVRRNLGLPDARLEMREDYKMAIAEVIRELQPKTVILPYWEGRHPDHYNAAKLGYEACFVAGLKNYPLSGRAFRPFKIMRRRTKMRARHFAWIFRSNSNRGGGRFWLTSPNSSRRRRSASRKYFCLWMSWRRG